MSNTFKTVMLTPPEIDCLERELHLSLWNSEATEVFLPGGAKYYPHNQRVGGYAYDGSDVDLVLRMIAISIVGTYVGIFDNEMLWN